MRRALTLMLWLAACGGGTAGPMGVMQSSAPKSEQLGSRLRHMWHTANDGSVIPAGYFDKGLNTRCDFQTVAPDVELCIPSGVTTLTYDEWNNLYSGSSQALYTDPSCTTADVAAFAGSSCGDFGVVQVLPDPTHTDVDVCGGNTDVAWYLSTALSPSTPLYYFGIPAGGGTCCSCQPVTTPPTATLMKMERLTSTNADQSPLVRAELSVDP